MVDKPGCVLKAKASGEVKVRLVTDLRRSGGNGRVKIRERVVLPRVLDLVFSILRLLEVWEDVSFLDLIAIDFTDAFHTLWLHEEEGPLCVFESDGVFYSYVRLPFGLASAPLIWGRVAAAALMLAVEATDTDILQGGRLVYCILAVPYEYTSTVSILMMRPMRPRLMTDGRSFCVRYCQYGSGFLALDRSIMSCTIARSPLSLQSVWNTCTHK